LEFRNRIKTVGTQEFKTEEQEAKTKQQQLESKTEPIWFKTEYAKTNRSSSNWTSVQIFFFFSFSFLHIEDEAKTTEAIVMKQNQLHYGVCIFLSAFCFWWN
jgi:hypothetical protein